jgi:hypothetical protein
VTRLSLPRLWEHGIPREGEDDCWVGEAMVLRVTASSHLSFISCFIYIPTLKCFKTAEIENSPNL